jgi:hypothetical protein
LKKLFLDFVPKIANPDFILKVIIAQNVGKAVVPVLIQLKHASFVHQNTLDYKVIAMKYVLVDIIII